MAKPESRDYAHERRLAIKRGETLGSNSGNARRKRARRAMESALGRKLATSEHVSHKKAIRSGGSDKPSNLTIMSASKNLSDNGQSKKKKK